MQFQTHNFHKETPEEIQTKPLARQAKTSQTTMGNQFRQEQLNSTDIVPEEQTVSTDWTTGDFFQSHADLESLVNMTGPEPQQMNVALPFDIINTLLRTTNDGSHEKTESADTNMQPMKKPMVLPVSRAKNEKFQKAWERLYSWTIAQRVHGERIYPDIRKRLQQEGITAKFSAINSQLAQTDKTTKEGRSNRRKLQKQKKSLLKQKKKIVRSFVKGKPFAAKQAVSAFAQGKRQGKAFFKAFWGRKCYQFANKLLEYYHNGKGKSVYKMQSMAKEASQKEESNIDEIKQRDVSHRGLTLAELGEIPDLSPGVAVHVKIQFNEDKPYHTVDDFHHWVTYIGNGYFSDSKHPVATGAKIDSFLQTWVEKKFHLNKKGYRFEHLHNEQYATVESLAKKQRNKKSRLKPKPGLQSRVTAIYNPTAANIKQ